MALRWWDSFDYLDTAHLTAIYDEVEAGATIVAGGRCGTNCLRIQGAPAFQGVVKGFSFSGDTIIIGCAIKRISGSQPGSLFEIRYGSTPTVRIYLNNDGSFQGQYNPDAAFPTTAWVTSGGLFASNVFHHAQFKIKLSDSAGRVQIRVDGSLTDNYDSGSIQTIGSGDPTGVTGLKLGVQAGGSSGNLIYYDDLTVCDTSGATCKDFLGDVRVEALEPTVDGAHLEWTLGAGASHHAAVDDGATPDDDTSYIESDTVNQVECNLYEDSALPTTGTVFAVGMKFLAKKDQPGDRTIAPLIRLSAVDYVGSDLSVNQDSYTYRPEAFEVSPATSVAWTITEVNDAEYGEKLTN